MDAIFFLLVHYSVSLRPQPGDLALGTRPVKLETPRPALKPYANLSSSPRGW